MTAAPVGNDDFRHLTGDQSRLRHKRDGRETARPKLFDVYPMGLVDALKTGLRDSFQ